MSVPRSLNIIRVRKNRAVRSPAAIRLGRSGRAEFRECVLALRATLASRQHHLAFDEFRFRDRFGFDSFSHLEVAGNADASSVRVVLASGDDALFWPWHPWLFLS